MFKFTEDEDIFFSKYYVDGQCIKELSNTQIIGQIKKRDPLFAGTKLNKIPLLDTLVELLDKEKQKMKTPTKNNGTNGQTPSKKRSNQSTVNETSFQGSNKKRNTRENSYDNHQVEEEAEQEDVEEEDSFKLPKEIDQLGIKELESILRTKRLKQELDFKNKEINSLENKVRELEKIAAKSPAKVGTPLKSTPQRAPNSNDTPPPRSNSSQTTETLIVKPEDLNSTFALKIYNKVSKGFNFHKVAHKLASDYHMDAETIAKIQKEFTKFMVLKVLDNDYDVKLPSKLAPPPLIHKFWKTLCLDSFGYCQFLKVLGVNVHHKYDENEDRLDYIRTRDLYRDYFPNSVSELDHKNIMENGSCWPWDYLVPTPPQSPHSKPSTPSKRK
ncbi:hypothetical protein DDB_G0278103 [Dictyostelium discoideum AX4]|uniref:Uncharacterized protein n=1 Tax=Dictyostelium discoideum TaxID=44689 RepID=Q54YS8_DICDI|nr:hypothetical protein DDB_G0278103 [Dictyostelium discoideum AX4]EAL68224.1 hypothetical protein DDB_G0278103 [Dictyostelium discoideum AX4]|eukprot:XP_642124.1 hypothetical protein DDB_G0278103 [Dictyostelium discoideum AX4]